MIQLVFAQSNGDFGSADGMPWPHISQDFKNFKARTKDTTLVMGAKTFASLPCKLPGRDHIVICDRDRTTPCAKNGDRPDVVFDVSNTETILKTLSEDTKNFYSVIGGKDLLKKALPYATKVIMTDIMAKYDKEKVTQRLDLEFIRDVYERPLIESNTWDSLDGVTMGAEPERPIWAITEWVYGA